MRRAVVGLGLSALLLGCAPHLEWAKDSNGPSGVIKSCRMEQGHTLPSGKPGVLVTGLVDPFSLILPKAGEWRFQCDAQRLFDAAALPRRYMLSVFTYQANAGGRIDLQDHLEKRMRGLVRKRVQEGFESEFDRTKFKNAALGFVHGFFIHGPSADTPPGVTRESIFVAVQPDSARLLFLHYTTFWSSQAERADLMKEIGDTLETLSLDPR